MKYRRSKMRQWITNLFRGKLGREADAECAVTLEQLRARRERHERSLAERRSGILVTSTPSCGPDSPHFTQ